jgi:LytR cell envelope-related transcriptional attenuator
MSEGPEGGTPRSADTLAHHTPSQGHVYPDEPAVAPRPSSEARPALDAPRQTNQDAPVTTTPVADEPDDEPHAVRDRGRAADLTVELADRPETTIRDEPGPVPGDQDDAPSPTASPVTSGVGTYADRPGGESPWYESTGTGTGATGGHRSTGGEPPADEAMPYVPPSYQSASTGSAEGEAAGHGSAGDEAAGHGSAGDEAAGHGSAGDEAAGHGSAGYGSAGYESTGYESTGYEPTGYEPTGYESTGYESTGYESTGYESGSYDTVSSDPRSYAPRGYGSREQEESLPDPSTDQDGGTGNVPIVPVEGGWERVRRRHRRQTLTFLAGLFGVLIVGLVAWLIYSGALAWPFGGKVTTTQSVCTRSKPLSPHEITLRVYNGSDRTGLAASVSAQLTAYGFTVQETGNDPLEAKLRTPIEVRHGASGKLAALTTKAYLLGKVRDVRDDRQADTVDVVLGPKFTRLHNRREANRALAALQRSLPLTCPAGVTPPASATR